VYGYDSRARAVAIQVGLTQKVVRFPTDEHWDQDEEVIVTVTRKSAARPVALDFGLPGLEG
jgi:hypothetical protein